MQGAAQRKVQAQLGVVGALRGAVAQDELEAENQRLRAELDTERRTRSGRQLLVEPEAPPEMVAPQAFADPAALVRTASMSQAASYHPPPAPPSSARAAPAPAQGSFTAGEDYWAVPDDAPQPTPPADRSQSMVGQSLQQSGASVATASSYAAPQYSPAPTDSRDAPAELDETGRSDWF
jgi:hypothetical protein